MEMTARLDLARILLLDMTAKLGLVEDFSAGHDGEAWVG